MKRFLRLSSLSPGVSAVSREAPADDREQQAKPVVVPFELLPSGHMTVMVKVNGKGPYRLIFDTGAPITLLNNKRGQGSGPAQGCA